MISGVTTGNERAAERLDGVRQALAARGIALAPGRVVEKPYTLSAGREGLREVLRGTPRPTAVICGNDVLAIGALAECHAQGLAVPREISVTGFDDLEMAAVVTPALTTVHFPTAELGTLRGAAPAGAARRAAVRDAHRVAGGAGGARQHRSAR